METWDLSLREPNKLAENLKKKIKKSVFTVRTLGKDPMSAGFLTEACQICL